MSNVTEQSCARCGALFVRSLRQRHKREWCSDACRVWLSRNGPWVARPCAVCGSLLPRKSRPDRVYCSDTCRFRCGASAEATCAGCRAEFVPNSPEQRFCSAACGSRYGARRVPERPCAECGEVFAPRDRRGRYCSKRCWRRVNDRQRWAAGKRTNQAKKRLRKVAERDGWRCHLCGQRVSDRPWSGQPDDATVDHLVPRSEGGSDKLSNLALAHNRCNWERQTGGDVQLRLIG